MLSATTTSAEHLPEQSTRITSFRGDTWRWLAEHWPLMLVLAVAAFLRFFRLQTTEFDFDQANLFQLAHDTIAHGLIPLSSNESSIGTLHAPFFIYVLLPAAALNANPLGGAIIVSLCTTAAAGLTYLFTLRYFGRLPAIVAGLLYATGHTLLNYSRGIWQPNLLTLFLLLFLFAVYRGAVERKGGWLAPAVVLLAILYQLDPASIVGPAVMLLMALLLALQTLHWRDALYAFGALIILFFPYLLLQLLTNFADARSTLAFLQLPAHTDSQVAQFYWGLIFPFNGVLTPLMNLVGYCLMALLPLGTLTAALRLLRPRHPVSAQVTSETPSITNHWLGYWQRICLSPERVSFLLLLTWQIVPFASLIHHAVDLHMQYLLVFLPGPFILIGLAIDEGVHNLAHWQPRLHTVSIGVRWVLLSVAALLIIGQSVGTTVNLFQATGGQFNDRGIQTISYSNDLNSLWNAVHQADALAQERHIQRLFINMDATTQPAITYLSTTVKTPTTDFGNEDCLLLPAPGTGAAIYLIGPYVDDIDALLRQFASVTLVAQPPRLSGTPFSLYIVTPKPVLPGQAATTIAAQNNTLALSRWQIRRNAPAATRTLYNYQFTRTTATTSTLCTTSALHANDQLLVAFPLVSSGLTATSNNSLALPSIQATAFDTVPTLYQVGPFEFTTFLTETVNRSFTEDVRPET